MNTVLCCLIWEDGTSDNIESANLRVLADAVISHAKPESLTPHSEPPLYGDGRMALYELLQQGFAEEASMTPHELLFTGVVRSTDVYTRLQQMLEAAFHRPVMLTSPIDTSDNGTRQ